MSPDGDPCQKVGVRGRRELLATFSPRDDRADLVPPPGSVNCAARSDMKRRQNGPRRVRGQRGAGPRLPGSIVFGESRTGPPGRYRPGPLARDRGTSRWVRNASRTRKSPQLVHQPHPKDSASWSDSPALGHLARQEGHWAGIAPVSTLEKRESVRDGEGGRAVDRILARRLRLDGH